MPPEIEPEASKKKFLVWGLIGILTVLIGAVTFFFIYNSNTQTEPQNSTPVVKKDYTNEEKLRILANLTLASVMTPEQAIEKVKILSDLTKNAPKESASTPAAKLKTLQSLTANAGQ